MLFSQMEPPSGREDEFHRWYDDEHIPARLEIAGFSSATRYRAVDGEPSHLAVYELSDMAALDTPEYRELKENPSELTEQMLTSVTGFTRYICDCVADTGPGGPSRYLSVVAFTVPDDEMQAFDRWYEEEHTELLMQADDWLRVSRYRRLSGEGGPWNCFALHELRTLDVLQSSERERARTGPLRQELAARPWFAESGRWVYETISRETAVR